MARNVKTLSILNAGRDMGKKFIITEMDAFQGESWAYRALLALIGGGVEVPPDFQKMSMAAMAEIGFKALSRLKWEVAEPLLSEMMQCVTIQPDPNEPRVIRAMIPEDIEEISTIMQLRVEVWKLHVDFFKLAAPSFFADRAA